MPNRYDGCYYVRCMLPLQANLWDGSQKFLDAPRDDQETMFRKAMASDIVVFQRPDQPDKTEAIKLLKQAGKKIVFDNDDTYKPDSGFPRLEVYANKQMIEKVNKELMKNVEQADLVTTTTNFLAKEYSDFNKNVVVLPNCVDPVDWPAPKRNKTKKIRIGMTGSVGYDDFKVIQDYLVELSKRDDVQIVMFGLSLPECNNSAVRELYKDAIELIESNGIEWHRHKPMSQYSEYLNDLRLDIMLIPRRETYFNKCKSNIKYLEASMLEIPVVASTFTDKDSPYDKDIVNGNNGFLATVDEFPKYTEMLIKDKKLREDIGKNAKEYVLNNYDINNNGYLWKEAFKKLT